MIVRTTSAKQPVFTKQLKLFTQIQGLQKRAGFFCLKNNETGMAYYMPAQCVRNSALSEYLKLDRGFHRDKALQADFDAGAPIQALAASYTEDVFEAEELMDKMKVKNQRYEK